MIEWDAFECLTEGCGMVWKQRQKRVYDSEGNFIGYSSLADCPRCHGEYAKWLNWKDGRRVHVEPSRSFAGEPGLR